MKRPTVRCRCGHQVLAKEVLRTDLYERPSGREYVYVKYRCKRCKRVGETFVAENRWDWRIFETAQNEMSEAERDAFADQSPITSEDLLDFHRLLKTTSTLADTGLIHNSLSGEQFAVDLPKIAMEPNLNENKDGDKASGSTPEGKADVPAKLPRTEPKRADIKSSNDALNSNPDVEAKKDNKKDAGKTGGPEDGVAR